LVRRFRSLLYAPADDPAAVEAAADSAADAVILDLEDRVPAHRKAEARAAAVDAVCRLGPERIVYVRVNAAESGLLEADLDAVVQPGLAGVRVPKTEAVGDVQAVDELISAAEQLNGVPMGQVAISIGLESAAAVRATWELCTASTRVASVAVGLGRGGDLQADLGFVPGDDGTETLYLRSKVVLDARAARVPIPLDGGYGTYRSYDPAREEAPFLRSAETGRRLGYRAKICFHVAQVEAINRIFGDGWAA
jgi:citrate lyase subunit beta / citryl-CoA lyase